LRVPAVSFSTPGYVALCEIKGNCFVTYLAVRHRREDDYD